MMNKLNLRPLLFWPVITICLFGALLAFANTCQAITLQYARRFNVEMFSGCHLVSVRPTWNKTARPFRYLLVPRGTPVPENHPPAQVIFVPVRRLVSLSTTHLGYIDAAQKTDTLVGLSGFKQVNTPSVRRLIDDGKLKELGQFTNLRMETLLELSPDVIFTSASGSIYDVHPKLIEAGLPTVLTIDHLEEHPLGRCEWIKFQALLLDTLDHAERLFNDIVTRYERLVKKTANISHRPAVITNVPFQGQWFVPKADSFVAKFIHDAGGSFSGSRFPGVGSFPMDIEAVYDASMTADIWLNTGTWQHVKDAVTADPRFAMVPALKKGRLYNNNKRLNPWGGNDYWESGIISPDVVLADVIFILRPDLLPNHELVYYKKLR